MNICFKQDYTFLNSQEVFSCNTLFTRKLNHWYQSLSHDTSFPLLQKLSLKLMIKISATCLIPLACLADFFYHLSLACIKGSIAFGSLPLRLIKTNPNLPDLSSFFIHLIQSARSAINVSSALLFWFSPSKAYLMSTDLYSIKQQQEIHVLKRKLAHSEFERLMLHHTILEINPP